MDGEEGTQVYKLGRNLDKIFRFFVEGSEKIFTNWKLETQFIYIMK